MKILGIETSCDETAAGVVEDGRTILSSVIRTQFDLHGRYGGVVPELASRRHIEVIVPVVDEALRRANLTLDNLDGLAVTQGPGLVGALLVGLNFAKSVSLVTGLPLAGVNHLAAHVSAGFLTEPDLDFPAAAMVVSGGHTNLYLLKSHLDMELLGQTRDDAAGEAYDKVAKVLGLGYPGGKAVDDLAARGNPTRFDLPRPMRGQGLDFSFSGLKTAVLNLMSANWPILPIPENDLVDLAASFQAAVLDVLTEKIGVLLHRVKVGALILAGGVAANNGLRRAAAATAEANGVHLILPTIDLCTDNAAMVATAGHHLLRAGRAIDLAADAYSRCQPGV